MSATVQIKEVLTSPEFTKKKFTLTINQAEWAVLSRTLCLAMDLDKRLKKMAKPGSKRMRFWDEDSADMEHKIAKELWNRLLLLPKRSSAGLAAYLSRYGYKYEYRAPDYRDKKWHKDKAGAK